MEKTGLPLWTVPLIFQNISITPAVCVFYRMDFYWPKVLLSLATALASMVLTAS